MMPTPMFTAIKAMTQHGGFADIPLPMMMQPTKLSVTSTWATTSLIPQRNCRCFLEMDNKSVICLIG